MTTMTLTPTNLGDQDPAYYAGRADAYDDAAHLTIHELNVRTSLYIDLHPNIHYAAGYADRVLEIRMEQAAVIAAETELAHTPTEVTA